MKFDRDTLYDDFPVTDYYNGHIKDAVTFRRSGNWWSAALLIEDPKSEKNIIMFYKWQKTDNKWKLRSKFKISDKAILEKIKTTLDEYANRLP